MIVVDIIIVVIVVLALLAGLRIGLFAGLGWWAGIAAGGIASPWVVPVVLGVVPDAAWRGLAAIVTVLALLAIGAAIGTTIGAALRRGADRIRLRFFERLAGGLLGVVAAALAAVMAGSAIASAGIPVVSSSVASSSVLRTIDRYTPAPVAEALARLRSVVVDDALPALGGVLDPGTDIPESDIDTGSAALDQAAQSVARISGIAYSCGTGANGTGFVADDNLIVTNAHVVAGSESVVVELPGEAAVDGRVVYFDPTDDLALISADVEADALTIAETLSVGDDAAVQGYPYGGPFSVEAATVMSVGSMPVRDIYEDGTSPREVYTLATTVQPGNSGGPVLTPDGEAAGVVFARDEGDDRVGYAMTTAELLPALASADAASDPVSTGSCTTD
ncbi:MAG: MarP family serine protease [Microbacterium sp.]